MKNKRTMSVAKKFKRYVLIIDKIKQSHFPTLKTIDLFLKKMDIDVTERTLQRDIEDLRHECSIYIEYDRLQKGYYIDQEDVVSEKHIQFLRSQFMSSSFSEFLQAHPKHAEAIVLSNNVQSKGIEYIDSILLAIRQQRQLVFSYRKFSDTKSKSHTIQPYAIIEYQQRWYVVGTAQGQPLLLKFGLDRIEELEIRTQKFIKDKSIQVQTYFSRIVGISGGDAEREIVRLAFSKEQAKYIETLPLHWSQTKLEETENFIVFEYFLVVNFEWMQLVLSYGNQLKILTPKHAVKEHKRILKETLKLY